jgi:hypothetical protein
MMNIAVAIVIEATIFSATLAGEGHRTRQVKDGHVPALFHKPSREGAWRGSRSRVALFNVFTTNFSGEQEVHRIPVERAGIVLFAYSAGVLTYEPERSK